MITKASIVLHVLQGIKGDPVQAAQAHFSSSLTGTPKSHILPASLTAAKEFPSRGTGQQAGKRCESEGSIRLITNGSRVDLRARASLPLNYAIL